MGRPATYPFIVEEIERRIKSKEITDRLPNYRALITEFKCSSRTIDKVLDSLRGKDLIYTVPGHGIYLKKDE